MIAVQRNQLICENLVLQIIIKSITPPIDIGDRRFLNAMPLSASSSLSPPCLLWCGPPLCLCLHPLCDCSKLRIYDSEWTIRPRSFDLGILSIQIFPYRISFPGTNGSLACDLQQQQRTDVIRLDELHAFSLILMYIIILIGGRSLVIWWSSDGPGTRLTTTATNLALDALNERSWW